MSIFRSKAFVYQGRPQAVARDTLSIESGPRDLVVEVLMCARCGTDKTIYRYGHPNVDPYAPVVLGHELVGRIVQVGKEVRTLRAGIGYREGQVLLDAYLDFREGERVCFQSRLARYRHGLMLIPKPIANLSFQINGGYAEYMKVPETMIRSGSVLRVPDHVADEEAALVEPTACALESIFATPHPIGVDAEGRHLYRAGIQPGGNVCVIGSGTVSMIYALLALLEGAGKVVLIVRSESKRELVQRVLGDQVSIYRAPLTADEATPETLAAEDAIVADLTKLTGGYLFDDVAAANASPAAQRLMLRLYAPEGYAVGACFGGTHRLVDAANIDLNHYRAAKTVGTSGCSTAGMETILKWLESGRLHLRGLVSSRHFTLDDDPHEFFTTEADGLKPALLMKEI
ncbi:MAG: alcohol dehydrogenase catalytic domain-containing protein [Anaerolineae bacterium]|nr:alcohol dehydrogenase catalytic domain-containing protein [Anaerolineae bacterium]